jgi:hypothetical protein
LLEELHRPSRQEHLKSALSEFDLEVLFSYVLVHNSRTQSASEHETIVVWHQNVQARLKKFGYNGTGSQSSAEDGLASHNRNTLFLPNSQHAQLAKSLAEAEPIPRQFDPFYCIIDSVFRYGW